MCLFSSRISAPHFKVAAALVFVLALMTGCNRDEIKTYRVAKEHQHSDAPPSQPQLAWTLPSGWKETSPGQMSLATFDISGKEGQRAQVAITPLAGMSGREALIVNMWRSQVGASELSAEEVEKQLQSVEIAGQSGKLFEVEGKANDTGRPMRIVTAMVHRPDASWFFKLQGDQEVVAAQKSAFVEFLKTFKITEAPATAHVHHPGDGHDHGSDDHKASPASPQWKTPGDWKSVSPGPMQIAKFAVPEKNSAKADVTISVFPNSTGGTLANANRWRGQIGLPPVSESDLSSMVTPLDTKNPDAVVVDMTNGKQRLIGAIVPRDGQWFFFKIVGDTEAVTAQKDAFVAFAKSPI